MAEWKWWSFGPRVFLPLLFAIVISLLFSVIFSYFAVFLPLLFRVFPPGFAVFFLLLFAVSFSALQYLFRPCSIFFGLAVFFSVFFLNFLAALQYSSLCYFQYFSPAVQYFFSCYFQYFSLALQYFFSGYFQYFSPACHRNNLICHTTGPSTAPTTWMATIRKIYCHCSYLYPIWLILLWRL